MKYVPVNREDIPVSGRPSSKSATLFNEFLSSGDEIWKIELDEDDKTPESVRSSLDNYVGRHDLPITVFTRGGVLFIQASDTKPSERVKKPRKARTPKGEVAAADTTAANDVVDEAFDTANSDDSEYAGL